MSDTDENVDNIPSEEGEQTEKEKAVEEKEHDSGTEEPVKEQTTEIIEKNKTEGGGEENVEQKEESQEQPQIQEQEEQPKIQEEGEQPEIQEQEEQLQVHVEQPQVQEQEQPQIQEEKEELPQEGTEDAKTDKTEEIEIAEEDYEKEVDKDVEEAQEEETEIGDETDREEGEEGIEGDDEGEGVEEEISEESSEEEVPEAPVPEKVTVVKESAAAVPEKAPRGILSSSEEEIEGESEDEIMGPEPDHWDPRQFISGPKLSTASNLPINIMEFFHSFGYNCRKRFNLEVLDNNTVIFASGNYLNFFNLETREITFRRSALGGGIGHIKKNPNPEYDHFSVAECGRRPIIILYKWPGLAIECVLRGGAKRLYSNLDYSPDGEYLVSQSGDPDYMLTVWAWKQHTILLRNKSYINDVYKVKFSPYLAGHITTCGVAHIKFWKMAHTFTGLKLQGELGRFGKTEYSDIIGVLPMPDEKVISGCDWGNILVWDGGLIVLEVLRSMRKKCHDAPIVQLFYEDGELWTISLDGHVRIWWYEKIDSADPSDDDPVILLDPSYDFYTPGTSLVSIVKRREEESLFIAQDGNGGIWQIDLNTIDTPTKSIQYYKCHAGKVIDIATCSFGPYLASFGKDGRIIVYNYLTKKLLYIYQFPSAGCKMVWPSTEIIPSGDVIIGGFQDGQVRVCCLKVPTPAGGTEDGISLTLTQVIKTHMKPVTEVTINKTGEIVVSSSEDSTIFIYKVNNEDLHNFLVPIGFLPAPDIVSYMTWNPNQLTTLLVGCIHGQMMEVQLPTKPVEDTTVSLELKTLTPKYRNFASCKSQIRRDIYLAKVERHKERKRQRKVLELIKLQAENPGVEYDEELFLADSEGEETLEPLYIPPKQKIYWLQYTEDDTIWVSMSGFDAGYIYEYQMDQKFDEPYRFRMIADADDTEIYNFVYDSQKHYLIFAMEDGSIRLNRMNPDWRDLSNYWILTMHDNQYGYVSKMCFSYDEKYFFSSGHDGNIFASKFNHEHYNEPVVVPPIPRTQDVTKVPDQDGDIKLSLEETKIRIEQDRIAKSANAHKAKVREVIKELKDRYLKILNRNNKLLPSQIIPKEELEPDKRVLDHIEDMFANKVEVIKKKMEFDLQKSDIQMKKLLKYFTDPVDKHPITVRAINDPDLFLMSVRQRVMSPMFQDMMKICVEKIEEERIKGRPIERAREVAKVGPVKVAKPVTLEYFLLSLSPSQIEKRLGPKLTRMLQKYRLRRDKWEKRQDEWEDFLSKKPNPDKNHPDDEKFLSEAIQNIGDYKLKEADDYKAPVEIRDTTVKKYKQLLDTRLRQYHLRHTFIQKVYDIRTLKYQVRDRLVKYNEILAKIHDELPEKLHKFGPNVPEVNPDEFPEEKLKPYIILPEPEESEMEFEIVLPFIPKPTFKEKLQELLPQRDESLFPQIKNDIFVSSCINEDIAKTLEADFVDLLENYPEDIDTPIECELRTKRLTKMLFIQKVTICKMEEEIVEFNKKIEEAKKERLPVHVRGNFIDLFILTLNQELNILKRLEPGEELLVAKCNKSLRIVHSLEDDIDIEKNKKIEIENMFETNHIEEMKIQEKFKHVAENNKFYDFLKRVFRKKYRPPKVTTDSDSESESSSSSSEESVVCDDDASSVDSKDFGVIKQDLNICPKGCEVAIFNLTEDLRSKRHEIEQSNRELTRQLETVNKNLDLANRKLKMLMVQYEHNMHDLEVYQKERQDLLNQVKCTVALYLHQIHDYNPETDEISDFLLFSKTTLSQLYKRVGTLEYENLQQKSKYETYLKHLTRMKKDLRYMRQKIKRLLQQIQTMMYEKFGKAIELKELEQALKRKTFNKTHINELEEVVLKKLVYEIRIKNTNIKEVYGVQLQQINEQIRNAQDTLIRCIRENTNRLELLQVMNKEKKELVKVISSQPKRRGNLEKVLQTTSEFQKDNKKLEAILDNQNRTMFELKAEIKMLKTKGLPPKEEYKEIKLREPLSDRERKKIREEQLIEQQVEKEWPTEVEDYLKKQEQIEPEEEESEQEKPPKVKMLQEIALPGFYLTESEDIITSMIDELVGSLKLKSQSEIDSGTILRNILSNIMKCFSVHDFIREIIENIPFELTPKQRSLVQTSAERLHAIQEPDMSEESIIKYARELLEETVDEVLLIKGDPYEVLTKLIEELVKSVPKEFLLHEQSVDSIVEKITVYVEIHEVVIEIWVEKIDSVHSEFKTDMIELMNIILEKVYGTGIDYLYIINKNKTT